MVTLNNRNGQSNSTYFGGIFFAKADNPEIKNLVDLKGKVVEASSILAIGIAQTGAALI